MSTANCWSRLGRIRCVFFFFFSSRRRHTRFDCDWSSDVCSSDLGSMAIGATLGTVAVLIKQEILLVFVGGLFVIEAMSVILQVASYRLRGKRIFRRSEEHTSELQSQSNLVCRLLLEKKKHYNTASHLSDGFFFFNDTATTEIYTLSLHDALPISGRWRSAPRWAPSRC